jgi:hypothetical protein
MSLSSNPPDASSPARRVRWLIFAGVFAVALAFAAFTDHAWEDYYITYRVSKNLATGHGLVYTVGERVHAFTSPLNVLVPAALSILTGNRSDELVLWLFRVLSSALLAGAAVLLYESARSNYLSRLATAVLIGMFAFDAKIVDFSINGQEIAFMMFFLALALHVLTVRSDWTILKLGLAGAGLMWTRPDGFIYFGALGIGFLLFDAGRPIGQSRLGLLKVFVWAGALTTVLYLPWLLWAWHYFGSPIPHTIIAKGQLKFASAMEPAQRLLRCLGFPFGMLVGRTSVGATFLPANALLFGGWHWTVVLFGKTLACLCGLYWCVPRGRPQGRAASFAFMVGHFYLSCIAAYAAAWYLPACAILGIFAFAHMMQHALDLASSVPDPRRIQARYWRTCIRAASAIVVLGTLLLLVGSAYQLRVQQREIEDGTRKQIGLWLREHAASPTDTVFLEPLGYVGFFSQLKMLDTPGLCAPEVVAAERKLKSISLPKIIPEVHPDWLVLRPAEADQIRAAVPGLLTETYSAVKVFDASERIASYRWLPGRAYLRYDEKWIVFKRHASPPQTKASLDSRFGTRTFLPSTLLPM